MSKFKICKLCVQREANKKNSHIISKFLGIKMFGEKSNRFAWNQRRNSKPEKIQDLPKEDYLFCDTCEKKFSTIETKCANALLKSSKAEFEKNYSKVGDLGIKPKYLSSKDLLLFIYINYFRLHHSTLEGFVEFKLDNQIENSIRTLLNSCLSARLNETNLLIEKSEFYYCPVVVYTTDYFKEPTENFITVNMLSKHKIGLIICENWMFHLYQRESAKKDTRISSGLKYSLNENQNIFYYLKKSDWEKATMIFRDKIFGEDY